MTTGERIRTLRAAAKMTQSELSQRLGISPSAVGMYEQGRRQPDPETVLKLCRMFQTSADWLLFGEGMAHIQPGEPIDIHILLGRWRSELMAHTGRLFYRTAEGRRMLLNMETVERLCQAINVAAEVSLRTK